MRDEELLAHPEGGRYKEVFRSGVKIVAGKRQRDALTHIYFSLAADQVSRFHRVRSDEVWNLYEGSGLTLFLWDEAREKMEHVELSARKRDYCFVVKAGLWQAALPLRDKVLVGCSVAPGFEFQDFELIDPAGGIAGRILKHSPDLVKLVYP
jgi:predicted cupin superfamily sugar epimerase